VSCTHLSKFVPRTRDICVNFSDPHTKTAPVLSGTGTKKSGRGTATTPLSITPLAPKGGYNAVKSALQA
jgi:hypothetical protein